MNLTKRFSFLTACGLAASLFVGCAPVHRPTLNDARTGSARGQAAQDIRLQPGEVEAEIAEIDLRRRDIYVIAADGRRYALPYDAEYTRVLYHGREYAVDNLEAGDRIAHRPLPRNVNTIESIRLLEPVQARMAPGFARSSSKPPRDVVEGTVERVDHGLGVFEIMPRTGRTVTVSVPYNATAAEIDNFRALRHGDHVRVEGEFVNPESLQLFAFLTPRNRE